MKSNEAVTSMHINSTSEVLPAQSNIPVQVDTVEVSLPQDTDWFIEVEETTESKQSYTASEITTLLRANILAGKYQKNCQLVVHQKDEEGKWNESTSTLNEFIRNHFELRVLYQPVWSYAMEGLKWGAIVGIGLKLLDSLIFLGSVDPSLALFFLATIGVIFIPRFGIIGVLAVAFFSLKYTGMNFFIMGMVAALIGAILGCLPGMAIGGIIGYAKRNSISLAKDANVESDDLIFTVVILPLIGGCALLAFYIFVFNPWLIEMLG